MERILWIDLETTGFRNRHDVVQMAILDEQDGAIIGEYCFYLQPLNWEEIEEKALEVNGFTVEQLRTHAHPHTILGQIAPFFKGPFALGGYNIKTFDLRMLKGFFEKFEQQPNVTLSSIAAGILTRVSHAKLVDVLPLVRTARLDTENDKLEVIAQYYGIPHDAHDAMSDIKATRLIYRRLMGYPDADASESVDEPDSMEEELQEARSPFEVQIGSNTIPLGVPTQQPPSDPAGNDADADELPARTW